MVLNFVFWSLFVLGRLCAAQNATLPYNFTLAAFNTTLPNSNSTGAPLVLGPDGATRGITFHVTSTYASFPYNDFPSLGLFDGSLRAYGSDGSWRTNATKDPLEWATSLLPSTELAQNYSSIGTNNISQYSLLAFDGFDDLWSLCTIPSGLVNVVFNTSDTNQCYSVQINIVPPSEMDG